jgi:hypothetical protein
MRSSLPVYSTSAPPIGYCLIFIFDIHQGAWRNLVSSWTDVGAQWSGTTPTSDSVFHFGPVRLWTTPINSAHYGKLK